MQDCTVTANGLTYRGADADRKPLPYEVEHPARFLGKCKDCGQKIAADLVSVQQISPWVACPACDRTVMVHRLFGRVRSDKACDGRCMSATGPSCECSCGGANHGGRWV